ncbi:flagellar hook-basal body complex protein, partial [Escherichia coli]|nr:flagellar hook-basal body complex protein [Escherichia coli]
MDHAIYTAMGAASQTLNQQAVTASNLANASTPGFRAQLNALRAVPVEGLSLPTRTLVTASTPGADMTPGKMDYTSRPLDVALQQDGWLAVQTADGSEGYTRNGSIQVDPTGQLTFKGNPGIGEPGPISVPEGGEIRNAPGGQIPGRNRGDPQKR